MDTIKAIAHSTGKVVCQTTSYIGKKADEYKLGEKCKAVGEKVSSVTGSGYTKLTGRNASTDATIAKVATIAVGSCVVASAAASAAATVVMVGTAGAGAKLYIDSKSTKPQPGEEGHEPESETEKEQKPMAKVQRGVSSTWKGVKEIGHELMAGFQENKIAQLSVATKVTSDYVCSSSSSSSSSPSSCSFTDADLASSGGPSSEICMVSLHTRATRPSKDHAEADYDDHI